MNITELEKEQLYEEFKERMVNEGVIAPKSAAWKNQNNLQVAREHFRVRAENLRKLFDHAIWTEGLNWPEWEFIKKLICHTYCVSSASGIKDDLLEEANNLAIKLIDEVFDVNEKHLKRIFDSQNV